MEVFVLTPGSLSSNPADPTPPARRRIGHDDPHLDGLASPSSGNVEMPPRNAQRPHTTHLRSIRGEYQTVPGRSELEFTGGNSDDTSHTNHDHGRGDRLEAVRQRNPRNQLGTATSEGDFAIRPLLRRWKTTVHRHRSRLSTVNSNRALATGGETRAHRHQSLETINVDDRRRPQSDHTWHR